ncbi:uncharacterized protein LOC144908568 [Branchiostoma floridae x Branchiostoma belcheri]
MKTFFYTCLILLPVVALSLPADRGYQQAARDLESMMAEFMHIEKPKPTIALEAAQTVKAEENYKKASETRDLESMMAEFMHIDKPKPTIALEAAQTVKAEENYKKVQEEKLTEELEELQTSVLMLKIKKMVEEIKKDLWA